MNSQTLQMYHGHNSEWANTFFWSQRFWLSQVALRIIQMRLTMTFTGSSAEYFMGSYSYPSYGARFSLGSYRLLAFISLRVFSSLVGRILGSYFIILAISGVCFWEWPFGELLCHAVD